MDTLLIQPQKGIGTIQLGMTKDEVNACIEEYNKSQYPITEDKRYFDYFFKLDYDSNDLVNFIEISYGSKSLFRCTLNGIDVFNTKVEDLIEQISQLEMYDHHESNPDTDYFFRTLGITLWRSGVFTEEDMKEERFQELEPEEQEYEMHFMYFETVAVCTSDYYDR